MHDIQDRDIKCIFHNTGPYSLGLDKIRVLAGGAG